MIASQESEPQAITTFGFQERFCFDGTTDELVGWTDYLYQLAHGGRGSGKSKAGAIRLVRYLLTWPRAFAMVTAPTRDMLRTSTLPAVVSVLEQWGLFEGRDWTYNKTESILRIPDTGAAAFFASTEEPEHLRGQDTAVAWMDEPRDSPLVAFLNLQATLRQPGFPHQMHLTSTPVGRRHWLHAVFYPGKTDSDFLDELHLGGTYEQVGEREIRRSTVLPSGKVVESRYLAYAAKTLENPHGGEEHYAQLVATYGEGSLLARQELDGEFVLMEGLTYPAWNPDNHIVDPVRWPVRRPSRVLAGVDFGFANPAAIVVEGVDGEGRRYILDEFYQAGCSEDLLCLHATELQRRWGVSYFFCDTEDPRWIRALRAAGLPAMRANKRVGSARDISSGIGLCARALGRHTGPNQGQGFFVSPGCKNFIREVENYVRDEGRDNLNALERPRRHGDHAMDAWRYAEQGIIRLGWDDIRPETQRGQQTYGIIKTEMVGAR